MPENWTYAEVRWSTEDIKELKPEWTDEQALDFLVKHEDDIQVAMMNRGRAMIEFLLNHEEKE